MAKLPWYLKGKMRYEGSKVFLDCHINPIWVYYQRVKNLIKTIWQYL